MEERMMITVPVDTDPITGSPHISPQYAHVYRSTDTVKVDYDAEPSDDGSTIIIRRTVWTKHRNSRNRHIVWMQTAMVLPRETVADHVRDIILCLAVV